MRAASFFFLIFCFNLLSGMSPSIVFAETAADFKAVTPGLALTYPRDHGAHPDYKTEWWYFTGHLTAEDEPQPRFGFELVFFRIGIQSNITAQSAWKADSLFLAHFAVTDDRGKAFFSAEQAKRGSFGDAGAAADTLNTWNGNWSAKLENGIIRLHAAADGRELSLELRSGKAIVLHGDAGYSKKGPGPGEASYYSSLTRLTGAGNLKTPQENLKIAQASAWMDQEFTSSESGEAKIGWDWFALQLNDGSEVMLYQLRDKENRRTEFSAGTIVQKDGQFRALPGNEFSVEVKKYWQSSSSSVRYPAEWLLSVPSLGRTFHLVPTVPDQELVTKGSTGINYWEGRCIVSENGNTSGQAYVELVGYQPHLP